VVDWAVAYSDVTGNQVDVDLGALPTLINVSLSPPDPLKKV
jgi:hypothetical protein